MKRRTPWPLAKLLAECRNAATVYLTLLWLAGERRQVCCTRARIADVCGLYRDTITAALQSLDRAGWVRVGHGHAPARRWYRLTLAKLPPFPWAVKTRSRDASKTGKKPLKGTPRLSGKNPPNSLERVRAREPVAPSALGVGATPALCAQKDYEGDGPAVSIAEALGLTKGADNAK
jgi:hypothetical protein